jgi:hypothetical protein
MKRSIEEGITAKIWIHTLAERNFPRCNWKSRHDEKERLWWRGKRAGENGRNGKERRLEIREIADRKEV